MQGVLAVLNDRETQEQCEELFACCWTRTCHQPCNSFVPQRQNKKGKSWRTFVRLSEPRGKTCPGGRTPRTDELYFYSHSCPRCLVSPTLAGPELRRWGWRKWALLLLKTLGYSTHLPNPPTLLFSPPRPQLASGHEEAWAGGLKKSSGIVSPLGLQGCYMSLIWNRDQTSWARWPKEEGPEDFKHSSGICGFNCEPNALKLAKNA